MRVGWAVRLHAELRDNAIWMSLIEGHAMKENPVGELGIQLVTRGARVAMVKFLEVADDSPFFDACNHRTWSSKFGQS